MPLYEYRCEYCDEEWNSVNKVECRKSENCPYCGEPATLLISLNSKPQCLDYYSENLDAHITSPRQRKRLMKQKHLEEA